MKRVAIIFENFGNPGQPYLAEWLERLGKGSESLEIRAFTDRNYSRQQAIRVTELKPKGWRRIGIHVQSCIGRIRKKSWTGSPGQLPLVKYKPDVIHLHNAQQYEQYNGLILYLRAKLIISFRGYETSVRPRIDKLWYKMLCKIYEDASGLHFVSSFLMSEALQLGAPHDKCKVIYRRVDNVRFFPVGAIRPEDKDFYRIIAVGRMTWQKGYKYLLKAFKKIVEQFNCTLLIVGNGEEYESLKHQVELLGLVDLVSFVKHLDRAELVKELQASDLFVQASVSDALPNTLLEAAACGVPIVSTRAGGIPEVIDNGISGLLVDPERSDQLADAIKEMLSNPPKRFSMIDCGLKKVKSKFSAGIEATEWYDYYEKV